MPICLKSIPVSFFRELEEVDHRANLPVSDERWQQLTHVLADDPVLKQLQTVIQCGWPERKSDVPMCLRLYFDLREELVVQGNLIFKGPRLVCSNLYAQGTNVNGSCDPYWYQRLFVAGSRMPLLAYDGVRCQRLCFQV